MLEHISKQERLEKLLQLYDQAIRAPFYARKYASLQPPVTWEDWQRLPVLSRDEIYANAYPRSQDMLTCPLEGGIVVSTGGSTGIARYTWLTHAEWDRFADVQAASLKLLGVRPVDRVANLFVAGQLWPSFLGGHEIMKRLNAVHLPIAASTKPEDVLRLCVEFQATVMLSLPTAMIFYADIALKNRIGLPSLRLALYAGEQMSVEAERHFLKVFPNCRVYAVAYSSADAGLMGYPCPQCGFGTYHLPTAFQHIEILDPESLQPVSPGEYGEIFVTNLARFSMPIIRYRIGDVATFLPESCACKDPNPLFKLAGRAGEDFKLGGAYISMKAFDEALETSGDAFSLNYTLTIEDRENQMELTLTVESSDSDRARKQEPALRAALEARIPELRVGRELGYIRCLTIRFTDLGSLPRNPKTGKLKRLNDRRVVG